MPYPLKRLVPRLGIDDLLDRMDVYTENPQRNHLIVVLLYHYHMMPSKVSVLKVTDFDRDRRSVIGIDLSNEDAELFVDYMADAEVPQDGWMFPTRHGHLTVVGMNKLLKRVASVTSTDVRRQGILDAVRRGDPRTQKLSGIECDQWFDEYKQV